MWWVSSSIDVNLVTLCLSSKPCSTYFLGYWRALLSKSTSQDASSDVEKGCWTITLHSVCMKQMMKTRPFSSQRRLFTEHMCAITQTDQGYTHVTRGVMFVWMFGTGLPACKEWMRGLALVLGGLYLIGWRVWVLNSWSRWWVMPIYLWHFHGTEQFTQSGTFQK